MSGDKSSVYPKLIGSGLSGLLEVGIFHPFDTVSKRIMSNEKKLTIFGKNSNVSEIIFNTCNKTSLMSRCIPLYNGIGFAMMHRCNQRMYGYGGQPILKDIIERKYDGKTKNDRVLCETLAGLVIGAGESIFMPADVLKVKKQTNPAAFNNKSIIDILRRESYRELYKGLTVTTMRNMIGRGNLFFTNTWMRENVFKKTNQWDMTFVEYNIISVVSISTSILLTAPFDVIKTRIQNRNFGSSDSMIDISRRILLEEGPRGFFKGLNTKLFVIGPKIMFSFSMSQTLISYFEKTMANNT